MTALYPDVIMLRFYLQNIEDGKTYNLVMYVKSPEATDLTVSLTSSNGQQNLASAMITLVYFLSVQGPDDIYLLTLVERLHCYRVAGTSNWTKVEQKLVAKGTNRTSRLQITTNKKGVVWFDQVSLMPGDTYKVYYTIVLELDTEIKLRE
jgi:alpha-L-arabinofuranosidase